MFVARNVAENACEGEGGDEGESLHVCSDQSDGELSGFVRTSPCYGASCGHVANIVEHASASFDGAGAVRSGKWNNQFGNIGLIRLAEMYLIRAESNARLNTSVGASVLADYNRIRSRAGLAAATGTITVDQILLERRLELAHEGFRIHDIKRTKQKVVDFNFDADKLVFPIPFREIELNKALVQNPGY